MTINVDSMIHVDCRVQDCCAEFYINDIPVKLLDANEQLFHTRVAHQFLLSDVNTLKVVVFPNQTPSTSEQPYKTDVSISDDAYALVRIAEYVVGQAPGDIEGATVYKELLFNLSDVEDTETKPFVKQATFNLAEGLFPTWGWSHCKSINLRSESALIDAFVNRLHSLFSSGNGRGVAELASSQINDVGMAIPARGAEGLYKDLVSSIEEVKTNEEKTVPLDVKTQDYRLCANGKFVQLINKDWQATIRTVEDETGYSYPYHCFIGKLDGNWQIVL